MRWAAFVDRPFSFFSHQNYARKVSLRFDLVFYLNEIFIEPWLWIEFQNEFSEEFSDFKLEMLKAFKWFSVWLRSIASFHDMSTSYDWNTVEPLVLIIASIWSAYYTELSLVPLRDLCCFVLLTIGSPCDSHYEHLCLVSTESFTLSNVNYCACCRLCC